MFLSSRSEQMFLRGSNTHEAPIEGVTSHGTFLEREVGDAEQDEITELMWRYLAYRDPRLQHSHLADYFDTRFPWQFYFGHRIIQAALGRHGAMAIRGIHSEFLRELEEFYELRLTMVRLPGEQRRRKPDWFHVDAIATNYDSKRKNGHVVATSTSGATGHLLTTQAAGIGALCRIIPWHYVRGNQLMYLAKQEACRVTTELEASPLLGPGARRATWRIKELGSNQNFNGTLHNRIHEESITLAQEEAFVREVSIGPEDIYIFNDELVAHGRAIDAQGSAYFID